MDKQTVLATVWHTMWHSYCKKMYVETLRNFTGEADYFEALSHIGTKAANQGYSMKIGRKYISLEKKV